jgi:uncharacterized protein (TIGR03435 family)
MRTELLLLVGLAVAGRFACGQASHFDVVSITPSTAPNTNKSFRMAADGGFRAGNYSLKDLIRLGWDVRDFQISGGPGWLDKDRYNIQVKPDAPFNGHTADGEVKQREMIQAMLRERFHLQLHQQTKEMNVYYLVAPAGPSKLKRTGDARDLGTQMGDGNGQMWARKFDMTLFAKYLGGELGLPVLDQTGLPGVYDFELSWSPDDVKKKDESDTRPSMITAVKEQLGLELKRSKGPVETVVVDSAEKASAN